MKKYLIWSDILIVVAGITAIGAGYLFYLGWGKACFLTTLTAFFFSLISLVLVNLAESK